VARTPVRRALDRARKPVLLALLIAGVLAGMLYKNLSAPGRSAADVKPPAAAAQKQ